MTRAVSHRDRPFWLSYIVLLFFILILTSTTLKRVGASFLPDLSQKYENSTFEIPTNISVDNSTANNSSSDNLIDSSTYNSTEVAPNTDVYVIKAVVYEIGILTDTDNTTSSESTERQERVDISLYSDPQQDEFS